MGDKTGIAWTDATWNPVGGCSKVNSACTNCYAMGVAYRFAGTGLKYDGLARKVGGKAEWTNKIALFPEVLDKPLRWKRPRMIFVNSMSDLFHADVPTDYIDKVFAVMAKAQHHTFQVLTKRPERMREYLGDPTVASRVLGPNAERAWPLSNVWCLVSVGDQEQAGKFLPELVRTNAAVKGVSYEPAIGAVDFFGNYFREGDHLGPAVIGDFHEHDTGEYSRGEWTEDYTSGIDWIIVGGESGPRARLFDPEWARSVIREGANLGVPVFVKQMGANPVGMVCADHHGGDWDEWPDDLRVRQFPEMKVGP